MALEVYGLKNCSSCRQARSWLDDEGIEHRFIDYRDDPVGASELKSWAQQLGGWEKLVNRSSTTWRNLPEDRKQAESDSDWLALIADYPTLVRRPVIWDGEAVSVGFNRKRFEERYQA